MRERLDYLDCDNTTLKAMPEDECKEILKGRREIVRLLVDKVTINSHREVVIEGIIDDSTAAHFELVGYCIR